MYDKCLLTSTLSLSSDPTPKILLDPATGKVGNFQKNLWLVGLGKTVCTSFIVYPNWQTKASYYTALDGWVNKAKVFDVANVDSDSMKII
jgi:hypothetical protein